MNPGSAERKLRELILAKGGRDRVISTRDEEDLLRIAIAELNIPFSRAEGIIFAVAENTGIEIESDVDRAAEAMVASLAVGTGTISQEHFEIIADYLTDKLRIPKVIARSRAKALVDTQNVAPARSGFLQTTLWYRRIGQSN